MSDQGSLWRDNQIGLRLAKLEEIIEKKFKLKLVRREDFISTGNLSKASIEQATRLGVKPAFLTVQEAIKWARAGNPDVLTYISKLANKGISVRPMLQQRELVGFGYKFDGQPFAGKQLGVNWSELKKEVSYVADEHFKTLADLKQLVDAGKTRPASEIEAANRTAAPAPRGEWKMESTQRPARSPNQETIRKPATTGESDRRPKTLPVQPSHFDRLAELHARMDARRIKFAAMRAKLEATPSQQCELSEAFISALNPSMTEVEVATAFLQKHGARKSVCALLENLTLTSEQMTELLVPYQSQIKNEAAYDKRMREAEALYQRTDLPQNQTNVDILSM